MRGVLVISLDVFGKFADSDFELFWGGNFVDWMNRSLGGLGKNTQDILKQKMKKIRKKGTCKLLKSVKDREWAIDLIEKESKKKN